MAEAKNNICCGSTKTLLPSVMHERCNEFG